MGQWVCVTIPRPLSGGQQPLLLWSLVLSSQLLVSISSSPFIPVDNPASAVGPVQVCPSI